MIRKEVTIQTTQRIADHSDRAFFVGNAIVQVAINHQGLNSDENMLVKFFVNDKRRINLWRIPELF